MTGPDASDSRREPVVISIDGLRLNGDLTRPATPRGLVVFAHGSGSSRLSPRNRAVAEHLVERGLATLLLDLLTEDEERVDDISREYRFDVPRLADRLVAATDWGGGRPGIAALPVGYFGASTGAAAALIAAAERPERVAAVVSRGGRPDLADGYLERVRTPTLLIVGGNDPAVIDLNRDAAAQLRDRAHLEIIPGATHLFEERGALDQVAELAGDWLLRHLDAGDSAHEPR